MMDKLKQCLAELWGVLPPLVSDDPSRAAAALKMLRDILRDLCSSVSLSELFKSPPPPHAAVAVLPQQVSLVRRGTVHT